jgi:mannose-6-phosphate isomerase-like protein (cupin superfamily)
MTQNGVTNRTPSRRIVAAKGADGRSCVVSNEPMPQTDPQPMAVTCLWSGAVGRVDNAAPFAGGFAPFGMHLLTDPVYAVMIAEYGPDLGRDDPGMHYTDTADHFYVIEGEVVLVLEAGDVVLRQGDIGICRGAVHGWRNDSGKLARLLTFVLPAEPLER